MGIISDSIYCYVNSCNSDEMDELGQKTRLHAILLHNYMTMQGTQGSQ